MKFIAHRGNTNGPNIPLENSESYIINTINNGFDCEIDVRKINDKLFLGHDDPQYEITINFLLKYADKLWIHCKNLDALSYLSTYNELNIFWHQSDNYTLTSNKNIWAFPTSEINEKCIIVMPELNNFKISNCYGICSDFIQQIKAKSLYDSSTAIRF
jgi:hypothetical protein